MARINIEEEAWKRIYRLSEIVGCSVREAVGTVACLWGNSQDLIKTHGSKQDIIEWASLFKISDEDSEKWILGLEKARFISLHENHEYRIHGNEIQIENRISKFTRASKGGEALKKKLKELKKLKAGLEQASGTLEAGSKGLKTKQSKAEQSKTKQSKAKQLVLAAAADFENRFPNIFHPDHREYFEKLQVKVLETWIQLYPAEWIDLELLKAIGWMHANAQKSPKSDFPKFFNGWLMRGWETHRKSISSAPKAFDPMTAPLRGA